MNTLTEKDKLRELIELAVKNGYWFDEYPPEDRESVRWEVEESRFGDKAKGVTYYWNDEGLTPLFFCILELLFDVPFLKALTHKRDDITIRGKTIPQKIAYEIVAFKLLNTHLAGGSMIDELYNIIFKT